jgi:SAM-dependent methyltransferase
MLERNTDKDWKRYGSEDPYYGVVSNETFQKDRLTDEARAEFFKTGEDHVDYILGEIRQHVNADFSPRTVLDFGCGVGRCTLPFGKYGESVLGIDVSEAMIEEGKKNAERLGRGNVNFEVSEEGLANVKGPFDLIHSFIVFQHIPPRRGFEFIGKLIDQLSVEGVAALHVLYHAEISRPQAVVRRLRKYFPPVHWAANLFYGKPWRYPLMEKNEYNLNQLFFMLRRKGCGNMLVRLAGAHSMHGMIIFCQKRSDDLPYDKVS